MAATLVATLVGSAQATTLYKWLDEDGNITYQDTPPPNNVEFESNDIDGPPPPLPTETGARIEEAALENPVSLYTVPTCDSCDLVRLYLEKNSIPFVEKNVRNDIDLQKELEGKAGALTVPTLIIGDRVLDGYSRAGISAALNEAGFPVASATRPVAPEDGQDDRGGAESDSGQGLEPLDLNNTDGVSNRVATDS